MRLLPKLAAAAALAAALLAPAAQAAPSWTWGSKDGQDCLAAAVGQYPRAVHYHVAPKTGGFPAEVHSATTWVKRAVASDAAKGSTTALLSFALLPEAERGQFARCARGAFDGYWREIATAVAGYAIGRKVVEPGWEANIGSGAHPWGVDRPDQLPDYKGCFRRAAGILRAAGVGHGVEVSWTSAKRYSRPYSADQMNPGDDAYDVLGLMYYDNYRPTQSQATWDKYMNSHLGTGGSPSGIGSWLTYAKSHGKKLGVSEWGVWGKPPLSTAQADDPVYIANMHSFFHDHAADISHETYQNNDAQVHQLCPVTVFPAASATYLRLWAQP
jgi:hypothetical protein